MQNLLSKYQISNVLFGTEDRANKTVIGELSLIIPLAQDECSEEIKNYFWPGNSYNLRPERFNAVRVVTNQYVLSLTGCLDSELL